MGNVGCTCTDQRTGLWPCWWPSQWWRAQQNWELKEENFAALLHINTSWHLVESCLLTGNKTKCQSMQEIIIQSPTDAVAVNVEMHHRLLLLAQGEQMVTSEPEVPKLKTFALVLGQAENDGQVGVSLSPTAIPTRRALLVRLLITCHTLASMGVNLYGCRLRSKEQVRNGLQSLAFPSYRSGVPTHGTEIILGSGRIEAEDSSVGTVNEKGWVDISCCNWAKGM